MSHGKYFSANYTLLGVALLIVISFIYFLVFEKDSEYLRLMTEYYLAPIFYIIFSLLYGLTYNIINQAGLKRTTFFGGYTIRFTSWNKIKHFAQVDEEWRQTSGVTNNNSIWFIGHDNILYFRIVAKNDAHLKEIIDQANKYIKKYDKILKYTDPNSTIHRIFKVNYNKIKTST